MTAENICNTALVEIAEASGDAAAIYAALIKLRRAAENDALERAAKACEAQREEFRSPEYATGQPFSSVAECFAADKCARAIRALKQPETKG